MKKIGRILMITTLLWSAVCTSNSNSDADILRLQQNWQIQSSAKVHEDGNTISTMDFTPGEWYSASVPTTVLAALVEDGVYPDPYYGLNLKSIPGYREGRWLVMPEDSPFRPSWWYRTAFEIPADYEGRKLVLHFDGINYQANIWLNGHQIAGTDEVIGMFLRFEFDINEWTRIGENNVLAVEIISPGKLPDKPYRTKQIEATTGWDDHNPQPPDMNMGIWEDVYITTSGPVTLRHPYVVTDLDLPSLDVAHLTVSAQLTNKNDEEVTGVFSGQIENNEFEKEIRLEPGETRVVEFTPDEFSQLNIENPRVWWPNPVGPQELYELNLAFRVNERVSDREKVRFGIREVSTYINEEGWRGYMVNGKKILIRGGAWMTSDMLLRLTPERYEALVRYAKEANLNMLRSEGFSIRETEEFYNFCDQYGVMVTQQIFGRSIPDEELAIQNIEDMILRIRNHPSLVHFLGHDETFPTETLDKAYQELIARYTPERTYQPHSGAFNIEDRFKTGGTRTGTRELWTYANPSHYYLNKEDGAWGFAQSGGIGGIVAPIESIRKMMPEKDLWPPFNETFSFHTVIQGVEYYNALFNVLETRYGKANGIEDFALKGQALNYESARGMYEAYARNKYDALGITTWKYDAAWPAALTWQYVDWYLRTGGAYYGAKKACEPLHVQYSYDDHSIYVVNSFYEDFENLKVTAKVLNFDMSEKYSRTATVNVSDDGKVRTFTIDWPEGLSQSHFLSLKLHDSAGQEISSNFYWLSTVPDIEGTKGYRTDRTFYVSPKSVADHTDLMKLPRVQLEMFYDITEREKESIASVRIKNPSQHLAFQIHLSVTRDEDGGEVTPTYWEDNYFSLLPGESKEVQARFDPRDLEGARAVVKVNGWNVE